MNRAAKTIHANRHRLTPQQYRTLKGQALNGDESGALRGLARLLGKDAK